MFRVIDTIVLAIVALAISGDALAAGYPWRNHAAPYDFLFGNEIDTHQQTVQEADGSLAGFLYVHYTGESTTDGLPIARHADCATTEGPGGSVGDPPVPGQAACDVGWLIDGVPTSATFLYQVDEDHPVWLVDRADIPQPGAYAHFHWLEAAPQAAGAPKSGYLLALRAVARFCFVHHDAGAGGTSCRERGGVVVVPGDDIATHLNIVASFPAS